MRLPPQRNQTENEETDVATCVQAACHAEVVLRVLVVSTSCFYAYKGFAELKRLNDGMPDG